MSGDMPRGSESGLDALEATPARPQPDTTALVADPPGGEPPAPRRGRATPTLPRTSDGAHLLGTGAAPSHAAIDARQGPSRRLLAAKAVAASADAAKAVAASAGGAMRDGRALDASEPQRPRPRGGRPGEARQGGGSRQNPAGAQPGRALVPAGAPVPARMKHASRPVIDLDELWAPMKPNRAVEDREFLPGALEILEAPASPIRVRLIYALCGLIATALAWSWFGHLDVYADATGKVQASGRTKVVQPIAPGQVQKIFATDGDRVKAGAVLLQLDPTTAIAERNVTRDQLYNARAEAIRHAAEISALTKDGVDAAPKVDWPADMPKVVVDREKQALSSELSSLAANLASLKAQRVATVADRDKYQANLAPQQRVIDLITEHLGMGNQLYKDGWNSRLTVIGEEQQLQSAKLQLVNLQGSLAQAAAAIPVIDAKIELTRQTFVSTNTAALVGAQQQVDKLRQDLDKANEKVDNMTLTAPIDGTVQATAVTTVGQVVTTGQQLMQVVPTDAPLEIEAYILNTDAGFVHVGQDATIKVDTFPYTRYGTITGHVVKLAADALTGKQAQQQQGNGSVAPSADGAMSITSAAQQTTDLVFPVTVKPDQLGLMVDGRMRPLTSGMTVTVEIKTESRRAIDYILSPLHAMFEQSAQER